MRPIPTITIREEKFKRRKERTRGRREEKRELIFLVLLVVWASHPPKS